MRAISTFRYAEESTSSPANCPNNLSREGKGENRRTDGQSKQNEIIYSVDPAEAS